MMHGSIPQADARLICVLRGTDLETLHRREKLLLGRTLRETYPIRVLAVALGVDVRFPSTPTP